MNKREFSDLNPYVVLGVSMDASSKEIRSAFRKKALQWHPDKHGSSDVQAQKIAELEFKKIAWAYEVLSSTSKRETFRPDSKQTPFDFSSYWEEWGSTSWANFWDAEHDPDPISEENLQEIKEMWEKEKALTEQERKDRCYIEILDYQRAVTPWSQYIHKKHLTDSGIGRDRPKSIPMMNSKVACFLGSLVHLNVDAVVNAANTYLAGGGGIDGAIHYAAGEKLYHECDLIGGCKTGNVAITRGYSLPAKYIIHACGPVGKRPRHLSSCYSRALDVAVEHNIRTIAFPCISTGAYCYPLESATNVALQTVRHWLESGDNLNKIDLIIFGCFQNRELQAYEKWMQWYFPENDVESQALPEIQHLLDAPVEHLLFPTDE